MNNSNFIWIACFFSLWAHADDLETNVPVHLSKGQEHVVYKGSLSGFESLNYLIPAKSGQDFSVKISGSPSASFNVFAPGTVPGESRGIGHGGCSDGWHKKLHLTGDYTVQVFQLSKQASRGARIKFEVDFVVN
ncbi:hypothetical protein ACQCLI_32690 (plasmid) [Pseudomonas nitroreducens]|uniref:hypothetical protein n=1 Tax=Pseudomonas nitroreducens TaxID=46680 RepID=UPI003D05920F